jgi:glycine/D-amino acid oxidase-like deaminating enzyme
MSGSGVKLPGSSTTRRQFFSAALVGMQSKAEPRIEGAILDDSHLLGHRLRDGARLPRPGRQVKIPLLIVGGGIAGLCAAWRLQKRGFRDFTILEMEKQAGGNSRWGENEVSAYPWAAHYLPVPNRNATLVREICEEFGLVDEDGHWSERHLCHSPQERVFLYGRWQEGLEPETGVTREQKLQHRRFEERMSAFAATGEFAIPMDPAAKPSPLDRMSMHDWLKQEKFDSPYLHWYVNYACRDDYGSLARDTSAWAGIHYFAAREHEDERGPFVWPEGNGWLVKQLLQRVGKHVQTGAPVVRVEASGKGPIRVRTPTTEYVAQSVIWAAPTFLLRYLMDNPPPDAGAITYSPWITANLTFHRLPREQRDTAPAWDNVIYDSASLGYVVATHQSLRTHIERTVWTWYHALSTGEPKANRQLLLDKDWGYWKEFICNDLAKAHPDIRECVSRIDIMRFAHAMARPATGWMFHPARKRLADWGTNLVLANSDLSGFSIFEEAQYRGVMAADRTLRRLGRAGA